MRTNTLANKLDIPARAIRHYARSNYGKANGEWDFTPDQVKAITAHFKELKKSKKTKKEKQPN